MTDIERRIDITDGTPGHKSLKLGGIDISNAVSGYTVTGNARSIPEVTLDLVALDVSVVGERAKVFISSATRDLLVKTGWTPPEGVEGDTYPVVDEPVLDVRKLGDPMEGS